MAVCLIETEEVARSSGWRMDDGLVVGSGVVLEARRRGGEDFEGCGRGLSGGRMRFGG